MKDQSKTKQVLIQELVSLRQRLAGLKQSESEYKRIEETLDEQSRPGGRTWAKRKMIQGAAFYFAPPNPIPRG